MMRATAYILPVIAGAALMAAAASASAQAANTFYASDNPAGFTGPTPDNLSVPVTANMGSECSVISGGTPTAPATFGNTVNLGDIADTNGHLNPALATTTNAIGTQTFQVNCSGAADAISLQATPLATAVAAATGYANTVNYTAEVDFTTTGAPVALIASSGSPVLNSNFPAGVGLANAPGDITIKAYSFNTTNTTDILVASPTYQATVTVTIAAGT